MLISQDRHAAAEVHPVQSGLAWFSRGVRMPGKGLSMQVAVRRVVGVLKIVVPVAIIAWLVSDIGRNDPTTWTDLWSREKNWPLLALGGAMVLAAACLTFVRWYWLVRAIDLPFRLREAFRLGFLGYLLNFVSFGSVGGDLFKAYFIARSMPKRRAEAVATVVVDRLVGLYALLVVAAVTLLLQPASPRGEVRAIANATYLCAAGGAIGLLLLIVPGFTQGQATDWLTRLPKVGPLAGQLIGAVRMYRKNYVLLFAAGGVSIAVHLLSAGALYLAAVAIFGAANCPTLAEHLVIIPLAMVAGALPVTPAGLGTFEYVADFLYQHVSHAPMPSGPGLVVALAYRVMTIVIATIGVGFYLLSRHEVSAVLHEVETADGSPP